MLRAVLLFCAALSAGLLPGPADARTPDRNHYRGEPQELRDERDTRREERERRDAATEAARRAQMRNGGGRVLSVEPMGDGYRVKVLKDGVVRIFIIESN